MENKEKENYIDKIVVGSLIAFKITDCDKKLISGKVQSIIGDKFEVETKNGNNYVVPKSYIAWVNTNGRWPKGVMNAFKIVRDIEVVEGDKDVGGEEE